MQINLITSNDLDDFKEDLLVEIRRLLALSPASKNTVQKKYLKSREVLKLLRISAGTLHQLRSTGTIPFSRIGRVIFYEEEEILKMMHERKNLPR
ncbi:MAG: helix-turn-helix domain-containing protein [Daejeonella sp.]